MLDWNLSTLVGNACPMRKIVNPNGPLIKGV